MATIASVSPVKTGGTTAKRGEVPSMLSEAFERVFALRARATNRRRLTARRLMNECSEKYMMLFQYWRVFRTVERNLAQRNCLR